MKITGLNHITLAVSDLDRSLSFYRDLLGFQLAKHWQGGAYFTVGDLWFCISPDAEARKQPHPDYTHMAFSVSAEDFPQWVTHLANAGVTAWKDNKSEGDSFYFLDPDGYKLELHVGDIHSRLAAMALTP